MGVAAVVVEVVLVVFVVVGVGVVVARQTRPACRSMAAERGSLGERLAWLGSNQERVLFQGREHDMVGSRRVDLSKGRLKREIEGGTWGEFPDYRQPTLDAVCNYAPRWSQSRDCAPGRQDGCEAPL